MKLDSNATEAEIAEALRRAAVDAWGEARLRELQPRIESAAEAIRRILAEPLEMWDAAPDLYAPDPE
jgi:hypothetical protein